jgi:hypothetical protein
MKVQQTARSTRLMFMLELVGWVMTGLVVWAVLFPIHKSMRIWVFEGWNIVFMVVLLTAARYLFLLPHTFLAKRQILKFALFIAFFPLFFLLIQGLNGFMTHIEEQTWASITGHLPTDRRNAMEKYLWKEMIFFGAGSIIVIPVLGARLLLSIWRTHNEGRA